MEHNVELIERSVKGTLEVENAKPSPEGEKITREFLRGKIDSKTAISQIKKHHLGQEGNQ